MRKFKKKPSFVALREAQEDQMEIFETVQGLRSFLAENRLNPISTGFVPTMGALHEGHATLIRRALDENELVVVSIFVNPTQFNNSDDLIKYPRTKEKDFTLLRDLGVHAVFYPSPEEIYPADFVEISLDLGQLDRVMEGSSRPGHFKGVVNVVKRLFDIVEPDKAYFGQKDFQQVAVLRFMIEQLELHTKMIVVPTKREASGLAMSSRNLRLSAKQKEEALTIYRILSTARSLVESHSPLEVKSWCNDEFTTSTLRLEYCSIVDPHNLNELQDHWVSGATCCVAAYCGEVRLIDNLQLLDY